MPITLHRLSAVALPLALLVGCRSSGTGPTPPGRPAQIFVVSGADQTVQVGTVPATSPVFVVRDADGRAVPNVPVRFVIAQGNGTLTAGDSVDTGSDGQVTLNGWRLGGTVGLQAVRAAVIGEPIERQVGVNAVPGPAVVLQRVATGTQTALVGEVVTPPPSLRVRDNYGNAVPGESITWSVSMGEGSVVGPSTTQSSADGTAAPQGWRLGPSVGPNRLTATSSSGITLTFDATAVGPPAAIEATTAASQSGYTRFQAPLIPRIRVLDGTGAPIADVPVLFEVVAGDGTIAGGATSSALNGIAAPGDWRLGDAPVQQLRASVPGAPGLSVTFTVNVVPRDFTIDLRFLTPFTPDQRDGVVAAAAKWMEVIIGDLPDRPVSIAAQFCGIKALSPAINETVDDVIIFAGMVDDDGPGGVAGRAYPCVIRSNSAMTAVGHIELDRADAPGLISNGSFTRLAMHELGHAIGMTSQVWVNRGLMVGSTTDNPYFTGARARLAFTGLGLGYSGQIVPLENTGGSGTRDSHWRETVLNHELMTGWLEPGGAYMPLTAVTVGALGDMGYEVDMTAAEPFNLAGATLADAIRALQRTRIVEEVLPPRAELLPDGTLRPFPRP